MHHGRRLAVRSTEASVDNEDLKRWNLRLQQANSQTDEAVLGLSGLLIMSVCIKSISKLRALDMVASRLCWGFWGNFASFAMESRLEA